MGTTNSKLALQPIPLLPVSVFEKADATNRFWYSIKHSSLVARWDVHLQADMGHCFRTLGDLRYDPETLRENLIARTAQGLGQEDNLHHLRLLRASLVEHLKMSHLLREPHGLIRLSKLTACQATEDFNEEQYEHFLWITSEAVVGLKAFSTAVDKVLAATRAEVNTTFTIAKVTEVFGPGAVDMLGPAYATLGSEKVMATKDRVVVPQHNVHFVRPLVVGDFETGGEEDQEEEDDVEGEAESNGAQQWPRAGEKRGVEHVSDFDMDSEGRHKDKRREVNFQGAGLSLR